MSSVYDLSISWEPAFRAKTRAMVQTTVSAGDRVLDIGVGTGLLGEYGASISEQHHGIDLSGAVLSRATNKIAHRHLNDVTLQWGSALALPFDDASFDAVVSSFTLPHRRADSTSDPIERLVDSRRGSVHMSALFHDLYVVKER